MIDEAAALRSLKGLARATAAYDPSPDGAALLASLMRRRPEFGITRMGSVTRLDRLRLPVVQVVRPLALSNAVTQGKGLDVTGAALSALLEALETWAAEQAPARAGAPRPPDGGERDLWGHLWPAGDAHAAVRWINGVDLLDASPVSVPLALVDTVYTLPSPHPHWFGRTTTGLAAGPSLRHAVVHAMLECLEREARWRALRRPHFFDRHQVDLSGAPEPVSGLLGRLAEAGLVAGAWRVPAPLPVYWCHVMEDGRGDELAPLPAEGFGCDITESGALVRALLEACQARLTAIAAAREDVSSDRYAPGIDREELARWRVVLAGSGTAIPPDRDPGAGDRLGIVLDALRSFRARRVVAVPLALRPDIPLAVVRVLAPPLHANPGEGLHGG